MGKPDLFYTVPEGNGLLPVVSPDNLLMKHVHMEFLRLGDGEACEVGNPSRELGIVILGGNCRVSFDGKKKDIAGRKDAFDGLPHAVYVPSAKSVKIEAYGSFEAVIYGTPAQPQGEICIIHPQDINVLTIGEGNWHIQGYFIIGSDFPAQKLIVGETQIPAGNWCSVPPHSHEKDIPGVETALEEIYYFKFKPQCGFGMQGVYTDDRKLDEAYIIRNNDVVLVPRGYHPNVAGPGYEMRMFWGMSGTSRKWIPYEDPDHAWLGKNANAPSDVSWE